MLIEFHIIHDHGPANMNRDQNGRPKTAFYGGTQRLRVSSQCWKRALRQPRPAESNGSEPGVFERTVGPGHFGVRTRLLPEKVAEKWRELHGADAPFAEGIKAAVSIIAKKDGKQDDANADGRVRTPQAIYIDLDREVDRIVQVLEGLRKAGELESLADEAQVFADHLKMAAEQLSWEGKDPSKTIAWDSVRDPKNWQALTAAIEDLELSERPDGVDSSTPAEDLVPTFELAVAVLQALMAVEAQDEKEFKKLLKQLAPSKKGKATRGARKSLAQLLKVTADRPVAAADIALFGRMTTSDAFRDVEAACQVADGISTHPVDLETDYFTAVDDLDTGSGAAHVGEAEFASAVFYHNLAVDFDTLLNNLGAIVPEGDVDEDIAKAAAEARQTAERAIEGLLRAVMHNVPSGKINSHAHNQPPSLIMVEVKPQKLATNYLTAFHDPARAGVREDGTTETLLTDSVRKLLMYARYRDAKMPIPGTRRFLFTFDPDTDAAIMRLREQLQQGESSPLTDDSFFRNSELKTCESFEELVDAVNSAIREGGAR